MNVIDPKLAGEIKKYGTFDFSSCYNCGECTAVCSITGTDASFPRMFIRYSMLGLKDEITSSKEIFLCYSCGDCSESCPRQASPGDLMAALRRYSTGQYEPSGLAALIYKNNIFSVIFTLVLALFLGFFLLTIKPEIPVARWLFRLIPFQIIHDLGMIAFIFMGISAFVGLVNMFRKVNRKEKLKFEFKKTQKAIRTALTEVFTMKRYRTCDEDEFSYWKNKQTILKPWFIHYVNMLGFLGLLLATVLDFIFKDPATEVWWPTRILGTISGIGMMYGTMIMLYYRIRKVTPSYSQTRLADWWFLIFLFIAGFTGFWLEISDFLDANNLLNNIVFLVHTIVSMELVILFAYSKFGHAFYRPLALFFHSYKNQK
jgi:ferredoxin